MDTPTVVAKGGPVPGEDRIYRALNPQHFEGDQPGNEHFPIRSSGDGVSTGIASLISISDLRSIEVIKERYGESSAIAELLVSEVLAPVATLGISVIQKDAAVWGVHAGAHAVITGYQGLPGTDGKKSRKEFQRHLVQLARKRYYPSGIDAPIGK